MSEITRTTPAEALPELLFVSEAAAWLGIKKTLAYEMVKNGTLPSVRLGPDTQRRRLIRVRRDALVAMAKAGA